MRIILFFLVALINSSSCGSKDDDKSDKNLPTLIEEDISQSQECIVNKKSYRVNSSVPSLDGCNSCECAESDSSEKGTAIICTEILCDTPLGCKTPESATINEFFSIGFEYSNEKGEVCHCGHSDGINGSIICTFTNKLE